METLLIITNNPAVEAHYLGCAMRLCADYQQVLLTARDAIHLGRCLLMHPESGSITPAQTPYRSLLLGSCQCQLDVVSLEMIENALTRYRSFSAASRAEKWREAELQDFQLIDLNLLREAVNKAPGMFRWGQ